MPTGLQRLVDARRYPSVRSCGDAAFSDAGPDAVDRYVADYGDLSLDAATDVTFKLCALPKEWMAVGLTIELPGQQKSHIEVEQLKSSVYDVRVELSVRDDGGRVVFAHGGFLGSRWVWSYGYPPTSAFVYAYDTMFVPRPGATYELHVSVAPNGNATDTRARLVVKGGGAEAPLPATDSDSP